MPVSKAQQKAVSKYMKENYDVYQIRMPKGRKDAIKAHAEARSESVNGFIGRAITETMVRDSVGRPQEAAGGGVVSLPPNVLETARRAAEAAGEVVEDFLVRAVETQAQRDILSRSVEGGNLNE